MEVNFSLKKHLIFFLLLLIINLLRLETTSYCYYFNIIIIINIIIITIIIMRIDHPKLKITSNSSSLSFCACNMAQRKQELLQMM